MPAHTWRAPDTPSRTPVHRDRLTIPVGLAYATLTPSSWDLGTDDHALVIGPARSGRSTVLSATAELLDRAASREGSLIVLTVSGRRPVAHSAWQRHLIEPDHLAVAVSEHSRTSAHVVVLIDDADRLSEDGAALAALLAAPPPRLHVVAAMDASAARNTFGVVARTLRRSRIGLALNPDPDLDGELFGVRLPRRVPIAMRPGLGYAIGAGVLELTQALAPKENMD